MAVALTMRHAVTEEYEHIRRLDELLSALKHAKESREGNARTGRQMLQVALQIADYPVIRLYQEWINKGICMGYHPIAFGLLVLATTGIDERTAVLAYLHNGIAAMVSNAQRLLSLGQMEAQKIIASLAGNIKRCVDNIESMGWNDLGASTPLLDIMAMQHEDLYSRLFMS